MSERKSSPRTHTIILRFSHPSRSADRVFIRAGRVQCGSMNSYGHETREVQNLAGVAAETFHDYIDRKMIKHDFFLKNRRSQTKNGKIGKSINQLINSSFNF